MMQIVEHVRQIAEPTIGFRIYPRKSAIIDLPIANQSVNIL